MSRARAGLRPTYPTAQALDALLSAFVADFPPRCLAVLIDGDGIHVTVPNVPALREWAGLLTDPAGMGPQVRGWLGATVVTVEVQ